ncbi:MAG: hypothetical protein ACQEQD_09430 [Bacillota bacterium]
MVSAIEWKKYESNNFVVFYPEDYAYQARETIYYLEKEREKIIKLTNNKLSNKIVVVVEDRGQFSNGFADTINNKIGIYTYPPDSYSSLSTYENWYKFLTVHELTHFGHLTNTSELSTIFQNLYGNLSSPNLHSPLWLIEGIAVYSESNLSPYSGRLNGGYYDAIFKAKSSADKIPTLSEMTYNHNHFPSGYRYLYGAKFIEYLSLEYGEEKLADLFNNYGSYFWAPVIGDVFPAVGLDLAAKKTYSSTFAKLYEEWKNKSEKENSNWKVEGKKIFEVEKDYISNLTSGNNGKIYFFRSEIKQISPFDYRKVNKLIEYDPVNNKEKDLKSFLADNYGTIKIENNKLYYLLSDTKKGFNNLSNDSYGTYTTLFSYNLDNGATNRIVSDEIRDFVIINDNKIIYSVTDKNSFGTKIMKYEDNIKEIIGSIPVLITEMKNYQDKIIIVSKRKNSSWNINYLNYENLNLTDIINTPFSEKMISIDGDNLLFTANYEKKVNIYKYNLKSNKKKKITNSDYAANGIISKGNLYFLSYYDNGMRIYKKNKKGITYDFEEIYIDSKNQEKDDFELTVDEENITTDNLKYLLKPGIRFFPFLLKGEDPLGYNIYQISLSPYGGFDFYYKNKYLNPLNISFNSYLDRYQRKNEIEFSYPLYRSQRSGLTKINTSLSTNFHSYFNSFDVKFSYPEQDFELDMDYNLSKKSYVLEGNYNYYISNSKLLVGFERYNGLRKRPGLREFIPEIPIKSGYKYNLDFSSKLFELRRGSWNPNIFIGDIYGKLFLDYNYSDSIDYKKLSGGGELIFESGIGNWIHLAPRLGISISENERKLYLGF